MPALTSLLARDEVVSIHKIEEALQRQVLEGGEIDTVLLELNAAQENVLNAYRAAVFGLRPASRHELMSVGPETIAAVPRNAAERYRAVPISIHGGVLSLAVSSPLPEEGIQHLRETSGLEIEIRIATEVRVEAALAAHYGAEIPARMRALALRLERRDPGVLPAVLPLEEQEVDHFDEDFLDELWADAAASEETPVQESEAESAPQPGSAPGGDAATAGQDRGQADEPEAAPGGFKEGPTLTGTAGIVVGQPAETAPDGVAERGTLEGMTQEAGTAGRVGMGRILNVGAQGSSVGLEAERSGGSSGQSGVGGSPLLMQSPLPKARGLVPRGPLTPGVARELLRNAQARDEVVEVFFSFARQYFDCSVLFSFRQDSIVGLESAGLVGVGEVTEITIPLDEGSVLVDVCRSLLARVVDLARRQEDLRVAYTLGRTTAQPSLLLPICIRQRPVLLLYGDRAGDRFAVDEVSDLVELLPSVSRAFERGIQTHKLLRARVVQVRGVSAPSTARETESQAEPAAQPAAQPASDRARGPEEAENAKRKYAQTLSGVSSEETPSEEVRERWATLAGIGPQDGESDTPADSDRGGPQQGDAEGTGERRMESTSAQQALSVLGVRPSQPLAAPPELTQPARRSTQRLQVSSLLVPRHAAEAGERAVKAISEKPPPLDEAGGPIGVEPPAAGRPTVVEAIEGERTPAVDAAHEPQDSEARRSRDTLRVDASLDLTPAAIRDSVMDLVDQAPRHTGPDAAPEPTSVNGSQVAAGRPAAEGSSQPSEAQLGEAPAEETPDQPDQGQAGVGWSSRPRVDTKDYATGQVQVGRTAVVGQPAEPANGPAGGGQAAEQADAAGAIGAKAAVGEAAEKADGARPTEPMGPEAMTPSVTSAQPSVIVDMQASDAEVPSIDALLDSLCAAKREDVEPIVMALVQAGDEVLPELVRRFPGPLWFEPGQADQSLPRGRDVSPVARAIFAFGETALPFVRSLLHASEADVRFCALMLAGDIAHGGLLEPVAELLFDTDPDTRTLAGSVMRRYRGVRGFGKVLKSLRGVAAGPGASTEWRVLAIEALAGLRDTGGLDVLLAQLKDSLKQVSDAAHKALVTITRQDYGSSVGKWTSWVERNQKRDRVEWLIDSLTHSDESIRSAAGAELQQISQEYYGYHPTSSKRDRERIQQKYREWWDGISK